MTIAGDTAVQARSVQLRARGDMTLPDIETKAAALVKAPLGYPVSVERICDLLQIRLLFVTAMRRVLSPDVVAAFEAPETKPSIYVDQDLDEWIFYHQEQTGALTHFFIAAQIGHVTLHVRKLALDERRSRFFLTDDKACRAEAAAFARALLMPREEFKTIVESEVRQQTGKPAKNRPLSRAEADALANSLAHRFVAPAWAIDARLAEVEYSRLLAERNLPERNLR